MASAHVNKPAYDGIYNRFVKRILDILISGAALLVLWPFYLIVALLIAAWVHRLVKTRGRFHDHTVEARGILYANKEAVQKLSRVYEAIGL